MKFPFSRFAFGGLFAAALLLQACGSGEHKDEKKAGDDVPATEVFTLEKKQLSSSLTVPGELSAFQQVDLYAKVSSFVKKLYVDVGSEVKAGQLLISLEAPELNSRQAAALSDLKSREAVFLASKANYDRLLKTSKTPGTISQNDLDQALARQASDEAQLEAAKAAYKEAGVNRDYLEIRAPFAGVITARNVSAGAFVGAGNAAAPIFTLQQQDKLRLVVSVPETYIRFLKNKTQVNFTVDALNGEKFTAHVSRLAGALDMRLRAQRTEMDVTNTNKKLLPGMVAEVMLPLTGDTKNFVIPSSAVLNSTQGIYVIRSTGNTVKWVPVKTGRTADDNTEVFSDDLKAGDVLVKQASEEIRDGSEIKKKG
ncbi:MAG: efflux RND transporter periplasmic adaptor subunit [Mucilaginibacter polytrichastri]|nr:efflux RND transporter periplasmic adaptor subunit [Mucilaginibacter polytrichastri]